MKRTGRGALLYWGVRSYDGERKAKNYVFGKQYPSLLTMQLYNNFRSICRTVVRASAKFLDLVLLSGFSKYPSEYPSDIVAWDDGEENHDLFGSTECKNSRAWNSLY
jgi:hypothetical protein